MLGLVITFVAAVAPAPAVAALPAGDATCAEGPACVGDLDQPFGPAEYATPAVIDCRSPDGASAMFGECDGTIHDASYRVSRYPDEQRTVELRPGRRDRRPGVSSSSLDSLPPRGVELTLAPAQPMAVFATATLLPLDHGRAAPPADVLVPPSRFGDPPDRPPRV
jgi:hypothetical protein